MASTPEGRIQSNIQKALRADGHFVTKIHGSATMQAGLPDLIVCAWGRYVGIEVKTPQTLHTVSEVQRLRGEQIRAAGGYWGVAASVEDARAICAAALRSHYKVSRKANSEDIRGAKG